MKISSASSCLLPAAIAIAVFASACDKRRSPAKNTEKGGTETESAETSKIATKRGNDKALARVADETITVDRFKAEYERLPGADTPERRRQVLDELVERIKLVHYAREKKIDQDPDVIRQIEDVLIQRVRTERFQSILTDGKTLDEKAVRTYYEEHPEEFTVPSRVNVAVIFVSATDAERAEKRARIEQAREAIVAAELPANKDFGQLATTYSEDPRSKLRGGGIGYLIEGMQERTKYPQEVFDTAFQLEKVGDLSEIVETADGYYLVKVMESVQPTLRSYDSAKGVIRSRLGAEARRDMETSFKDAITSEIDAEINDDLLQSLAIEPPQGRSKLEMKGILPQ